MVEAARAMIGTPFHHQGRVPGVGLDCVGLLVLVGLALGLDIKDVPDYKQTPDGTLEQKLDAALEKTSEENIGDVLVFTIRTRPQHVAIRSSATKMIHADATAKKVVEVSYDQVWQRRSVNTYRFPWQA